MGSVQYLAIRTPFLAESSCAAQHSHPSVWLCDVTMEDCQGAGQRLAESTYRNRADHRRSTSR